MKTTLSHLVAFHWSLVMNRFRIAWFAIVLISPLLLLIGCTDDSAVPETGGHFNAGDAGGSASSTGDSGFAGRFPSDEDASGNDGNVEELQCTPLDPRLPQDYDECIEAGGRTRETPDMCFLTWFEDGDKALYIACSQSGGGVGHDDYPDRTRYDCTMYYPKVHCPCGAGDCPLEEF